MDFEARKCLRLRQDLGHSDHLLGAAATHTCLVYSPKVSIRIITTKMVDNNSGSNILADDSSVQRGFSKQLSKPSKLEPEKLLLIFYIS